MNRYSHFDEHKTGAAESVKFSVSMGKILL